MNPVRLAVIGSGVLAAVTALALWLPHFAGADRNDPHEQVVFRDYSYNGRSSCDSRKDYSDPIGVVFVGDYAAFANVSDQIGTHTDWGNPGSGGNVFNPGQRVWVKKTENGYECRLQNGDRSDKGEDCSAVPPCQSQTRYHVRLWYIPYGPPKTVGTPHYEEKNGDYGHCVPPGGFDKGRRRLWQQFKDSHRHRVNIVKWGNTAPLTKCGKTVRSNGQVAIIHINHKNYYGQP